MSQVFRSVHTVSATRALLKETYSWSGCWAKNKSSNNFGSDAAPRIWLISQTVPTPHIIPSCPTGYGCVRFRQLSPQSAAHRISELNLFLYLRISGVSLGGRVLVGLTFTIEPFLTSIFSCSNLEPTHKRRNGNGSKTTRGGGVKTSHLFLLKGKWL